MKSLKISVGHWIILLSLIYIFDRTKLRELYTKFYVGETSYLLFAALCLQRSYIYGAFPFAWFPRVMKKSGIFTFDFKKIQKSGRKKTKSSNIFQIVRCILFIIVFITLGFLIQRVNSCVIESHPAACTCCDLLTAACWPWLWARRWLANQEAWPNCDHELATWPWLTCWCCSDGFDL